MTFPEKQCGLSKLNQFIRVDHFTSQHTIRYPTIIPNSNDLQMREMLLTRLRDLGQAMWKALGLSKPEHRWNFTDYCILLAWQSCGRPGVKILGFGPDLPHEEISKFSSMKCLIVIMSACPKWCFYADTWEEKARPSLQVGDVLSHMSWSLQLSPSMFLSSEV